MLLVPNALFVIPASQPPATTHLPEKGTAPALTFCDVNPLDAINATVPLPAKAPVRLAICNVPPDTVVPPVYVFAPASVNVPVPIFTKLPAPVRLPVKVLLLFLPPMLRTTGEPAVSVRT